jgi:hypothetical protein
MGTEKGPDLFLLILTQRQLIPGVEIGNHALAVTHSVQVVEGLPLTQILQYSIGNVSAPQLGLITLSDIGEGPRPILPQNTPARMTVRHVVPLVNDSKGTIPRLNILLTIEIGLP